MAFLSSFDISASALSAQRMRMDIAAENIANIDNAAVPIEGKTYCLKVMEQGLFVRLCAPLRRERVFPEEMQVCGLRELLRMTGR